MNLRKQVRFLFQITHSRGIARRYFVVNGFDGALTMLGMIMGFYVSAPVELSVVISACLGAAIALGVSGVSSAYVSETAEQRHALSKLQEAMVSDLNDTAYGDAARWVPVIVALVNGLSPLLISLVILLPLWMTAGGAVLPLSPLLAAIMVALAMVFLLGVYLGRISGVSWLRSGLQTLAVALVTAVLIYALAT